MRIDELPGAEQGDAAWWKLVHAMGVISRLEERAERYEAALRAIVVMNLHEVERYARDVAKAALPSGERDAPVGRLFVKKEDA